MARQRRCWVHAGCGHPVPYTFELGKQTKRVPKDEELDVRMQLERMTVVPACPACFNPALNYPYWSHPLAFGEDDPLPPFPFPDNYKGLVLAVKLGITDKQSEADLKQAKAALDGIRRQRTAALRIRTSRYGHQVRHLMEWRKMVEWRPRNIAAVREKTLITLDRIRLLEEVLDLDFWAGAARLSVDQLWQRYLRHKWPEGEAPLSPVDTNDASAL